MSQFLSIDAGNGLVQLLARAFPAVDVATIGEKDIDDTGHLVFNPPVIRVRHAGTRWAQTHDNTATNYDCEHIFELWCAEENLRSKDEQREDTEALVCRVAVQMAGARIALADGSKTEPVRLVDVNDVEQDIVGLVYILTVLLPGVAQFDGVNA